MTGTLEANSLLLPLDAYQCLAVDEVTGLKCNAFIIGSKNANKHAETPFSTPFPTGFVYKSSQINSYRIISSGLEIEQGLKSEEFTHTFKHKFIEYANSGSYSHEFDHRRMTIWERNSRGLQTLFYKGLVTLLPEQEFDQFNDLFERLKLAVSVVDNPSGGYIETAPINLIRTNSTIEQLISQ